MFGMVKMRILNRRTSLAVFILLCLVSPLFAQPMPDGDPFHHPRRGRMAPFGDEEMLKERIGVSDAQLARIRAINANFHDKVKAIRVKINPLHQKMRTALRAESVNLRDVRKLLEEIARWEVELRILRIEHRLELDKILTPEQKERWSQHMHRHRRGMHRD